MPRDGLGVGGGGGGVWSWARAWWRALLAELVGTALLVLLGVASALPVVSPGAQPTPPPLTHVALAFGCVVAALVQALGGVSGAHLNPAVSLAAVVAGRLPAGAALAYAAAQTAGAVVGFGGLMALAPDGFSGGPVGVTQPATGVGASAAAVVEAALTGLLVLACCALWAAHDPARPDTAAPTKLGLTVAGLIYSGGFLTGASLNPARSLAPALLQAVWQHHWVYWVGPMCGAAASAALHRWALQTPAPAPRDPREPSAHHETLPLHDKPDQ